jgi:hypothetical protein
LDFEIASRNAFRKKFFLATVYGCLFHYSQNIWRKLQEIKHVKEYRSNQEFRNNFRRLLSLAFVKQDKVAEYFYILKERIFQLPDKNLYEDLFNYFEKNYILINEDDLLFWNMFERVMKDIPRTTNSLEGFHRALNNLFLKSSPDLGLFGEELLKEHLRNKKKMLHALYSCFNNNSCVSSLKAKKENQLKEIILKFDSMPPFEYLTLVSLNFSWPVY